MKGAEMAKSSSGSRRRQRPLAQPGGAVRLVPGRDSSLYAQPALRIGAAVIVAGSGVAAGTPTGSLADLPLVGRDIALVDNWSLETPAAPGGYERGVALPAPATAPTFGDGLYFLLNDMLGIGNKPFADLFSGAGTVGDVLGVSGLTAHTALGSTSPNLMAMLGLDTIKLDDILPMLGLDPAKSFDQVLDQMQLGGVTLDFLLTPLGIPSTQTTLGLAHRFSVAHLTLGEMLGRIGISPNATLGQMLDQFGLGGTALPGLMGAGGLIGNMTCPTALATSMTLDQFMQCITLDATGDKNGTGRDAKGHGFPPQIHLNKNTTIEQILTSQHFYDSNSNHTGQIIGNWTLGEILSQKAGSPMGGSNPFIWNSSTTVQDLIDHIHVNTAVTSDPQGGAPSLIYPFGDGAPMNEQSPGNDNGGAAVPPGTNSQSLPTLGDTSFGQILTWINLPPSTSLADLITGKIWVGDHLAGTSTIGDILNGMIVDPQALGPIGTQVDDNTTIQDLLEGMGFGSQSLNDLLNLTAPTP